MINVFINFLNILFAFYTRVDDVEDGSELRRGAPVAHKIFGVVSSCRVDNQQGFKFRLQLSTPQILFIF